MKKIIQSSLLVLLFLFVQQIQAQEDFRAKAPKAGPAPKIELGTYDQFTLDNGLKVIIVENHKIPRVSFQLLVDIPPLKEGEYAGAADMAGQLLSTGTKNKSKAEIDETVDFMGANLSTSAGGVFASSLSKHKESILEIMAEVLLEPTFPQEEFDKLKKQTLSGLQAQKDDPNAIARNVARVLRFGQDHPYGELTTEITVDKIMLDHCKKFYGTYFKPNISYLSVVGDVDKNEIKPLVEKYFGSWKKGMVAKEKYEKPKKLSGTQANFVNKTGAVQSVVNITYPVDLKPGTPDVIKGRVMNYLLGGSGGRLYKNIREDKAYTYGAYSSLSSDREVGYFDANASVRNEVTDSAVVEFLYELNRLRDEKVPQEELDKVKSVFTGSFARSLEQPSTVARFALNIARYNLPENYYQTYLQKLNAVTVDDVQEMAKKYITPENAHILVVGNKDEVAEKMARFAANGKVNYYDSYGIPIKMSKEVLPAGLTAESVIEKYISAIGGKENLQKVKTMEVEMAATVQGMGVDMKIQQKAPGKFAMNVTAQGMVMQQQVFDGEKGMSAQMGQKTMLKDKELESLKEQSIMFGELTYKERGYTLELKGIEAVEGKDAYKVLITSPGGNKVTEFYDKKTSYKIRTIATQEANESSVTITTDLLDYKEVDGIVFPYTMVISGAMPFPLKMETQSIEVNKEIDDSVFKVE